MYYLNLRSDVKAFARREFFNPDVVHACIVTLGLVVPLAIGYYIGKPVMGSFAAITGQVLLTVKFQHTYAQKATILFFGLIFISAAVLLGTISGAHFWFSIIIMALLAGASSLVKEYGSFGQTIGFCAVILFLLALPPPHSLEVGMERFVAVWLGGLWSAFIILFLWPFRPDLPYYTTLAKPWELSSNLALFLTSANLQEKYADRIQEKEVSLRQAINEVLPYLRLHHNRYFFIRRDLLKLVRASSRFGATIIAMNHALEHLREHPKSSLFMPVVQQRLLLASAAAKSVVNALVLGRSKDLPVLKEAIKQLTVATNELQLLNNNQSTDFTAQLDLHRFVTLFNSAIHYLEDAHLLLTRINQKKERPTDVPVPKNRKRLLYLFKTLFLFKNVPLKHTLRLILVTSLGIILYLGFEIPRGYWISLTVMVVLQPDFGTTQQKAMQRVSGTFLGGILGTFLLIHPFPAVIFIIAIAAFSFLFIYYQQRNYTVSVTFLTMMLVAMFEVSGPIDWRIAAYRLFATVLGVILSVAAAFLLWPNWERTKMRSVMARGLRANLNLTHQLHYELLSQTGFHARIIAMRRKAESANIAIAESVKILQLEPGTKKQKQKVAQNISFYNARLTRELISFAPFLSQIKADNPSFGETDIFLRRAMEQLEKTITALLSEKNIIESTQHYFPFPSLTQKANSSTMQATIAPNPNLHVEQDVLEQEIVHEQLNKIADAINNLAKSVQALNNL